MLFNVPLLLGLSYICTALNTCQSHWGEMNVLAANSSISRGFLRRIVPDLTRDLYKGQAGRIAVVGGSVEYTGAPYYAAVTTLKTGGDIVWVLCHQEAATAIKSYSPEVVVIPVFPNVSNAAVSSGDGENIASKKLNNTVHGLLGRAHSFVVGPGLGRDEATLASVSKIIRDALQLDLPLVLDGDALFLLSRDTGLVHGYSKALLTPNKAEFVSLYKAVFNGKIPSEVDYDALEANFNESINVDDLGYFIPKNSSTHLAVEELSRALGGVSVLQKGRFDITSNGETTIICTARGSLRRCGGQGDILAGASGLFMHWAFSTRKELEGLPCTLLASIAASSVTRTASRIGFEAHRRSTTTPDIIQAIGEAMEEIFPTSAKAASSL